MRNDTVNTKNMFNVDAAVSEDFAGWLDALINISGDAQYDIEEVVWARVRESEELPMIADTLQEVVLDRLKCAIINSVIETNPLNEEVESYLDNEIQFEIANIGSSLFIGETMVTDHDSIKSALAWSLEEIGL